MAIIKQYNILFLSGKFSGRDQSSDPGENQRKI